mmetsp:Transcript_1725/g.7515  ORF Transcript_1725/g.7515 Transcript_1725/m.7515 type:complete len:279 (-) Transcript_1725:527-1363(-)
MMEGPQQSRGALLVEHALPDDLQGTSGIAGSVRTQETHVLLSDHILAVLQLHHVLEALADEPMKAEATRDRVPPRLGSLQVRSRDVVVIHGKHRLTRGHFAGVSRMCPSTWALDPLRGLHRVRVAASRQFRGVAEVLLLVLGVLVAGLAPLRRLRRLPAIIRRALVGELFGVLLVIRSRLARRSITLLLLRALLGGGTKWRLPCCGGSRFPHLKLLARRLRGSLGWLLAGLRGAVAFSAATSARRRSRTRLGAGPRRPLALRCRSPLSVDALFLGRVT